MTKIAFLYFDDIHHIFHSVTIAIELARGSRDIQVELLTSTTRNAELLKKIVATYEDNNLSVQKLTPPLSYSLLYRFRRQFPRKSHMLKKHRKYLSTFDAIVGTELTTGKLRRYLKHKTPKLIFANHGAGDRAYGFRRDIDVYDFLLIAGEKIRERLQELGILDSCEFALTGYAKFDYNNSQYRSLHEIFPETSDRTTVLYNPHFATHSSSWAQNGSEILDFFCESDQYNLILAPHIMLFDPRFGNTIQERWKNHKHIHIDTGSLASADMSYTRLADIYLGDVSSQVYEFVIKPRYCVFLNAHKFNWQGDKNFLHWTLGDVIKPENGIITSLVQLLENHEERQKSYLERQAQIVEHTFSLNNDTSASMRSANAISEFLNTTKTSKDG